MLYPIYPQPYGSGLSVNVKWISRPRRPNRHPLCRRKEAGDDADGRQDGVELPGPFGEDEYQDQSGAEGVAREHGRLERPTIDKYTCQDAEHGDRKHVGDLDACDLLSGCVESEGQEPRTA